MEPEENEQRGSGRSQNVVHTLPRSMTSVPTFLTGPLERVEPAEGSTQVLVLTLDAESALAIAEAVLRMTGPAGIEVLPVTTAKRASRLMAGRPVLAAAGSPKDIRDLIRGSHLKLDSIKSVVIAWADEILAGNAEEIEALEAVMNEIPKDAARIVVTSRSEGRVNAFAERYLRRARRDVELEDAEAPVQVPVKYVTVSHTSRGTALRRLLDDLDPPSAAIFAASDESASAVASVLRVLGYGTDDQAVRLTRDEVSPSTYAVVFYDVPTGAQLRKAAEATPVAIIALTEPRELAGLKRLVPGDVRPFTLAAAGNAARDREETVRRELSSVIDSGLSARDILTLEPLLERHDGIEIAAAALRLLEKERTLAAHKAEQAQVQAAPRESFDREGRPPRESRGRDERPRGFGASRDDRGGSGGRSFSRGAPRDGGSRPPRDGGSRGPRDSASRGPRDFGSSRGGPPRRDGGDRRPSRDGGSRPPRRDRP